MKKIFRNRSDIREKDRENRDIETPGKDVRIASIERVVAGPGWFLSLVLLVAGGSFGSESMTCTEMISQSGECTGRRCLIFKRPRRQEEIAGADRMPETLVRVVNIVSKNGSVTQKDKGSGVIVDFDGNRFLLTAAHIFREGIGRVLVMTSDGRWCNANVLHRDVVWDVVLLEFEAGSGYAGATLASHPAGGGDRTVAWGFGADGRPAGISGVAVGYVQTSKTKTQETLKTTGKAREGDSGGPVFNEKGELLGILWGTDGRYTYSTFSERLRRIIGEYENARNETLRKNESNRKKQGFGRDPPAEDVGVDRNDKNKENDISAKKDAMREKTERHDVRGLGSGVLAKILGAANVVIRGKSTIDDIARVLGYGTMPAMAAFWIIRRLLKRRNGKTESGGSVVTKKETNISLDDTYAGQLNALYELSGHSPTADATLGRLYDLKLRDAEQSSDAGTVRIAKTLRKQVADQFLRIHSTNPAPAESG